MRFCVFYLMFLLYYPQSVSGQRLVPPRNYFSDDEEDHRELEDENDEPERNNSTEKGVFVGDSCETSCSKKLMHVYCNKASKLCECDKKFPVRLSQYTGCSKPKRLGDQCYYKETCEYADAHSSCIQVHHNAICQCQSGYHSVSISKPSKRVFCAEDLNVMTTNFSTFAGVLSGIAVLSGLICFVLKLFNQNLYGTGRRRHRFGNANIAPPILFSSDPGDFPLPILERSSMESRASSDKTLMSRRNSSAQGCRIYGYTCRTGSRRPSLASIHSSSSVRSFSTHRYEREREQKEEREMQRRFNGRGGSRDRVAPTPSPHSTDDLLPALDESKKAPPLAIQEESTQSFHEEVPSTSKQYP